MTDYSEGDGEDDDKGRTLHDGRDLDGASGTNVDGYHPSRNSIRISEVL